MDYFCNVRSNDLSPHQPTQTHFDVADDLHWKTVIGRYAGIISEPPPKPSVISTIVRNTFANSFQFCALLIDQSIVANAIISLPTSSVLHVITVADMKKRIFLWINRPAMPTPRSNIISFGEEIGRSWQRDLNDFKRIITNTITHACMLQNNRKEVNTDTMLSDTYDPKLSLAYYQGLVIQDCIERLWNNMNKRQVISYICNTKYRTAQSKIRIAKHAEKFP